MLLVPSPKPELPVADSDTTPDQGETTIGPGDSPRKAVTPTGPDAQSEFSRPQFVGDEAQLAEIEREQVVARKVSLRNIPARGVHLARITAASPRGPRDLQRMRPRTRDFPTSAPRPPQTPTHGRSGLRRSTRNVGRSTIWTRRSTPKPGRGTNSTCGIRRPTTKACWTGGKRRDHDGISPRRWG